MVATLAHLTRIDVKFICTKECDAIFVGIKFVVIHAPIVTLHIIGEPFEVIYDASLEGIGVATRLLSIGKVATNTKTDSPNGLAQDNTHVGPNFVNDQVLLQIIITQCTQDSLFMNPEV